MKTSAWVRVLRFSYTVACVVMIIGCASNKRVDWNSRIGNYTFDQAVSELGPPDKQSTLSDGRVVADWITRRSGSGIGVGSGIGMGNMGIGVGHSVGSTRNHILRLTFHKDGRLETWTRE